MASKNTCGAKKGGTRKLEKPGTSRLPTKTVQNVRGSAAMGKGKK